MSRRKEIGNPHFGTMARSLMALHGIDTKELARRAEIQSQYMERIVKGEVPNPTINTALRVANAFGVSIDIFAPTKKFLDQTRQ